MSAASPSSLTLVTSSVGCIQPRNSKVAAGYSLRVAYRSLCPLNSVSSIQPLPAALPLASLAHQVPLLTRKRLVNLLAPSSSRPHIVAAGLI
jgi:hypothetical protein